MYEALPKYAFINKVVGETPLQALERFRESDAALADVPMTYAGRLDPMASGQLLILIGEECKKRDAYTALDKTYEFEVLLGVKSDTGDVLGMLEVGMPFINSEAATNEALLSLIGNHTLPYPAYSSKTVAGKPLFVYAQEAADILIPSREMCVRTIAYRGTRTIESTTLLQEIMSKLDLLQVPDSSDFRASLVRDAWRRALATPRTFSIISASARVATGTYIRSLAPLLGERLGTSALAFSIHRTAIHM